MGGYGMTREEEIKQKSLDAFPIKERYNKKATGSYDANFQKRKSFEEGAKWADKTMRERVLDFIDTYFYDHPHVNCHVCADSFESLEKMEEALIKAMEE